MPIDRVHSFLTLPAKNVDPQPRIKGTVVEDAGRLSAMVATLYEQAEVECDIPIIFRHDEEGRQINACRDLIVAYTRNPTLPHGRRIAERLQSVSTRRSGLGLLFLIKGHQGHEQKIVLSRFPAESGVLAEEAGVELEIEFVERVFMKNVKTYKSAVYSHTSFDAGFWRGFAVDRQISGPQEMSEYWIGEFLLSDLRTTAAAGTKRVATALVEAIRSTDDVEVRGELIAAARLIRGQHGRRQSARRLFERLGLSDPAVIAIERGFPRGALMDEPFQIDQEEFQRHAAYRSMELDNGGLVMAQEADFARVFQIETVDAEERRVRVTTQGRIVDENLRKTK